MRSSGNRTFRAAQGQSLTHVSWGLHNLYHQSYSFLCGCCFHSFGDGVTLQWLWGVGVFLHFHIYSSLLPQTKIAQCSTDQAFLAQPPTKKLIQRKASRSIFRQWNRIIAGIDAHLLMKLFGNHRPGGWTATMASEPRETTNGILFDRKESMVVCGLLFFQDSSCELKLCWHTTLMFVSGVTDALCVRLRGLEGARSFSVECWITWVVKATKQCESNPCPHLLSWSRLPKAHNVKSNVWIRHRHRKLFSGWVKPEWLVLEHIHLSRQSVL